MLVIVKYIVLGMRILRVPLHRNCKLAEMTHVLQLHPFESYGVRSKVVTFIRVIGS